MIIMLDATKSDVQRALLEKELESVGIRLNKPKPNIYFKVLYLNNVSWSIYFHFILIFRQEKKSGGVSVIATCPLTKLDEKLVYGILHEYSK